MRHFFHLTFRRLKTLLLIGAVACFVIAVFVVSLIVTAPVTVVKEFATLPAQVTGLYGTLWRGRATILGGYRVNWVAQPGQLLRGVLRLDVTFNGPNTLLSGQVDVAYSSLGVTDLSGRAGPEILDLFSNLRIKNCTSRAIVDIQSFRIGQNIAAANGVVSIDAGTCTDPFDRPNTVPALTVNLLTQGADAVAILADRDGQLAHLTATGDRRLILRIEPEGATLVPGLPTSGPIILEYPYDLVFPPYRAAPAL